MREKHRAHCSFPVEGRLTMPLARFHSLYEAISISILLLLLLTRRFPLWQGANCVLFPPAYGRSLNQKPPFRGGNNAVIASQVRKYPLSVLRARPNHKDKASGVYVDWNCSGIGEGNCFQMDEKTHNSAPCGLDRTRFKSGLGAGSLRPGPPACF